MLPVEQLRGPHLVLPHVRDHAAPPTGMQCFVEGAKNIVRHQPSVLAVTAAVTLARLMRGLHLADVRHPGGVRAFAHLREQRLQHVTRIALDAHRHRHQLADFRRVDIHMDHAGPGSKCRGLARHAVVKPSANVEQHVALLQRAIDVDPAVHPRHAQ